jgi:hypothetical protein
MMKTGTGVTMVVGVIGHSINKTMTISPKIQIALTVVITNKFHNSQSMVRRPNQPQVPWSFITVERGTIT